MLIEKLIILLSEEDNIMMIAKVTNLTHDYCYDVKNIVCINYVNTKIILVTKDAQPIQKH